MSDTTIAPPPKPSARNVAISRVRAATALYIVFNAPNTAPMAMRKAIQNPSVSIRASGLECEA
jgi:hypothetical protein